MASCQVILASASPRRQQLLSQIGVRFRVAPQDIDETMRSGEGPEAFVMRLAREKAGTAGTESQGAAILAADTIVVCAGQVLGKPRDREDALRMLALLSGREHRVLTAIALARGEEMKTAQSESRVGFRSIAAAEADRYWRSGESEGKAGAYAIQGLGAVFVNQLNGSYSGVMGLPLFETAQLLDDFLIPRWQTQTERDCE